MENLMTYIKQLTIAVNKALSNELSSAVVYHKFATLASGVNMTDFAKQLQINGDEEFDHFKSLMEFAGNHNIVFTLSLNDIINTPFTNDINIDNTSISNLEKQAYEDYRAIALLARQNDDIETEGFFIELMNDERKHLDSIFKLTTVVIGAPLSFKDMITSKI
jgi:ferritin